MPTTTTTTTTTTTSTSYGSRSNNTRNSGAPPTASTASMSSQPPASGSQSWQPHTDGTIQNVHDSQKPHEMGHGYGEDEDQHAQHASFAQVKHFGLPESKEVFLFYCWAIPAWCLEIVAGILGSYFHTSSHGFIACFTVFQFFSWAAWWQTTVQMMQRASWVRDEGNLVDRKRYLHLAVRLNRLMMPTAVMAFCVFIVAYVRRRDTGDLANWLLFLLVFIFNTVGCVMNAYNNITWESDRLEYEEGSSPYENTLLSILGIPTKPRKAMEYED